MSPSTDSQSDGEGRQDPALPSSDDEGQLATSEELKDVFYSTFPEQEEIVYAFGYGSGVFAQTDNNDDKSTTDTKPTEEKKMLDMIIIVKDAFRFHSINIQANPHHYAPLFRDASRATRWQKHSLPTFSSWIKNPKIFFNFVQDPFLKYGVMEKDDLCSDLQNWDSLYIAGRMHKPTATIVQPSNMIDDSQNNHNLPAALATALLLSTSNRDSTISIASDDIVSLPLSALYSQISALSYTGDFRMQMGAEDPAKIDKLVHSPGQLGRFHQLYHQAAIKPLIESGVLSLENENILSSTTVNWNPRDDAAVSHLWQRLPPRLQQYQPSATSTTNLRDTIDAVQKELHSIVAPAARYQSFKGLWTAGATKSARYAFAKLSKGLMRRS